MVLGSLPALPKYRTDLVTRRMCATAQLDSGFAREVLREFVEDGLSAYGPPLGINLVALVRHADASQRRDLRRDRALAALLALFVLLLAFGLLEIAQQRATGAAVALVGAVAVFSVSYALVWRAEWTAWTVALELGAGRRPALSLAPPLDPSLEQELELLKRTNMVPYHQSVEQANPFVGSGWKITETVWTPIDVGRPALDANGAPLQPLPFTAADLHHHLAVEMSKASGLGSLTARNRLYVRGLHVRDIGTDALPDPTRRPRAVIDSRWVRSGAAAPTNGMETYLCLRIIGEGGKVVVSVHLRAQVHQPRLSWEVAAYVLPPLKDRFSLPNALAAGPAKRGWRVTVESAGRTRPLLFGSAGRLWRRSRELRRRARDLERVRKEIRKGYLAFDYGAFHALREDAADWRKMGYTERRDAQTFFKLLVQAVLISTEEFLGTHHIDAYDLRTQQQQIINTQTTNFNGIINGGVQAGSGNIQNNSPGPTPPANHGAGGGGGQQQAVGPGGARP